MSQVKVVDWADDDGDKVRLVHLPETGQFMLTVTINPGSDEQAVSSVWFTEELLDLLNAAVTAATVSLDTPEEVESWLDS